MKKYKMICVSDWNQGIIGKISSIYQLCCILATAFFAMILHYILHSETPSIFGFILTYTEIFIIGCIAILAHIKISYDEVSLNFKFTIISTGILHKCSDRCVHIPWCNIAHINKESNLNYYSIVFFVNPCLPNNNSPDFSEDIFKHKVFALKKSFTTFNLSSQPAKLFATIKCMTNNFTDMHPTYLDAITQIPNKKMNMSIIKFMITRLTLTYFAIICSACGIILALSFF